MVVVAGAPVRCALQPFQGRNPCMERNLMPPATSEEDLSRLRAPLVDRSSKHTHFRSSNENDTQSLVANDFLQNTQQRSLRSVTPIPYVQNVVFGKHNSNALNIQSDPPPKTGLSRIGGGIRKLLDIQKRRTHKKEKATNLTRQADTQVLLDSGVVVTTVAKEPPPARPVSLAVGEPGRSKRDYEKVFSHSSADGLPLKNPSLHVKTPGDVPASVRRNRRDFSTRLSLYDDRIMTGGEDSTEGVLEVSVQNSFCSVPQRIHCMSETQLNDSTF